MIFTTVGAGAGAAWSQVTGVNTVLFINTLDRKSLERGAPRMSRCLG